MAAGLRIPLHEFQSVAAALNDKPVNRSCGYCSADVTSEFANCRHVIPFLKSDSGTICLRQFRLLTETDLKITRRYLLLHNVLLVKALAVPLDCFSRIASRDEDEITGCQSETHGPPNRGEQQRTAAGSDAVGG